MWLLFSAILAKNWRRTGNIGQKTVSYIVGDSKWMMEKLLIYYGKEMRLISGLEQNTFAYCNTIAMNILQNAEDAEECVSDTWLKIWSSIPPNYPKSFKTIRSAHY